MDPLIGTVLMFGGNFAPRGWAFCKGQSINIADNTALYSVIGTTYGGDATTFKLPDLQGRMPLHRGEGTGLSLRHLGETGGSETTTMTNSNMPSHFHKITGEVTIGVNEEDSDTQNSNGKTLGNTQTGNIIYNKNAVGANEKLAGVSHNITTITAGSEQPYDNMQPFRVINYIIALQGRYPARS